MESTLVKWWLCAGLMSVLLLALPVLPPVMTDASVVSAAEKAEPLDLNTATTDQPKAPPGVGDEAYQKTKLSPKDIVQLSVLATAGLVLMWAIFWLAVVRAKESVHEVLLSAGFIRTVTVMGVIASTVVLSLADRLQGNITAAILSGIVGYVLGQLSARGPGRTEDKKQSSAD